MSLKTILKQFCLLVTFLLLNFIKFDIEKDKNSDLVNHFLHAFQSIQHFIYTNLNIYLVNHVGSFNVFWPSSFRNSNCHLSTVNGLRGPQSDCPQCAVVGPPAFRHPEVWESQLITLLCGLWLRLGLLWFPFSGFFLFWFLLLLLFFISFLLKAIFKWMCQLSWTSEIRTSF